MALFTIAELEIMHTRQQIEDIQEWLRDHPEADPNARHEMRLRLQEQTELLNHKMRSKWRKHEQKKQS